MTKKATISSESRQAQRVSETLHRLEQLGIKLDDSFEVGLIYFLTLILSMQFQTCLMKHQFVFPWRH